MARRCALLLLGITVVLLIVGLLGMHALSGSIGGRSLPGADVEATHVDASVVVAAEARAAAPFGNQHIAVACVLALLAGLLLLTPLRSFAREWMPSVPPVAALGFGATRIAPPPPSLIQLLISRT